MILDKEQIMVQVDFYQAKDRFLEIIEHVMRGEDVLIERNDQPLVRVTAASKSKKQRVFGSARGLIQIAPDFNEPLDDFKEYM